MLKQIGFLLLLMNAQLLFAQNPEADTLQKYYRDYQLHCPQEKLFIHTDKTFYVAGETIWFKVYIVDAAFNRPVGVSSISYVEVMNQDHKSVLQAKVSMKGGFGNGFLILPGFLHSGNYILRGYTNWMKNFSPEFYFEQPVTIVNTLRRLTIGAPAERLPSIQFFPEGGNLVAGFSSRVAFKAVDSNGIGLNCQGVIVNQRNDTIVAFRTLHLGMGSFQLKPEKNTDYFAIMNLSSQLIRQKLPMAEEQGYLMDLQHADSGIIKIRVRATPEFDLSTVYLFAQTRQLVKSVQMNKLQKGEAIFTIDKKILGEGISTLTIFDASRQPVCERLVFKRPEIELDISATADQQVYDQRSAVHIDLLSQTNGHSVPAILSASVFMTDALQKVPEKDIVSYLWLSSDLRGNIESPDYYFRNADKAADDALDVLLLTQGWRRFNWTDILSGKKPAFEFLPELEGPVVNGKVVDKKTGASVKDADAFISIPGDDHAFNIASSDDQGTVRFSIKDIYRNNVVVMQPALKKDSGYRVNITSAWSEKFSSARIPTLSLSKNQQRELINRSIDNQIENSFASERKHIYPEASQDSGSFYGRPDKVYYLDNYIRYQTMEEVLREYVYDVRVRRDGEKFNFKVKNGETDLYFEGFPLIMADGIPVGDATDIIRLDPLKIKKIELVPRKYYIGSFVFEGIINVKSYSSDAGATLIDPNATVVEFEGIQMQREFYSPAYTSESERGSRLPDNRNVLYWAPQVSTGADGKYRLSFFSSDVKGKFLVFIQGITPDGKPGKSIVQFEVR
jgi:hypothetical protein